MFILKKISSTQAVYHDFKKRAIYQTNIYKPHLYIIKCNSVFELQQSKQNTVDQIIGKWNFKKIWEESETQINMIVKAVENLGTDINYKKSLHASCKDLSYVQ